MAKITKELGDKDNYFREQYLSREEQTNGQIRYLQKRLKEVTQQNVDPSMPPPQVYQQGAAYLSTVKQEMAGLLRDQVEMRGVIKSQCFEQSSQLVIKIKAFEDFRERVMHTLEQWQQKAQEISDLA